ncbi:Pho80p cyclin [Kickxella alabastrina]|uniref:Pho80p cyclin n=1 Tax=Kickxella alabastrina TaxID=61397 RepID=A0ACC1IN10_9FUNG|nr:Pho80p cyclin [Kickxella alabastrina]
MENPTGTAVFVMPDSYFEADIVRLTRLVANMFSRVVKHNDRLMAVTQTPTRFHSRAPPKINIDDYLQRISKYAMLEPACLLLILIYVDRICERNPTFTISSLTVHRFIITAATVACKSLCDAYCTNSHYAKVGGVSMHELNSLEVELLHMTGWHLVATQEQLLQYYFNLVRHDPTLVLQSDAVAETITE